MGASLSDDQKDDDQVTYVKWQIQARHAVEQDDNLKLLEALHYLPDSDGRPWEILQQWRREKFVILMALQYGKSAQMSYQNQTDLFDNSLHSFLIHFICPLRCDTLLHYAVSYAPRNLKILLDHQASVDALNHLENTPLFLAVRDGRHEHVNILLNARANVNVHCENDSTALMWASWNDDSKMCKKLLEADANPNLYNLAGQTPIMFSAHDNNLTCLELLLTAHGDPNIANSNGQTALMNAAYHGHVQCAKLLLAHKASLDTVGINGSTALMFAVHRHHGELARMLLSTGANPNIQDHKGRTALMLVAWNAYWKEEKTVELKVEADQNLATLKWVAHKYKNVPETKALLMDLIRAGVKVTTEDCNGRTAFHDSTFHNMTWESSADQTPFT